MIRAPMPVTTPAAFSTSCAFVPSCALADVEIVLEPDADIAAGEHGRGRIGEGVAADGKGRERPACRHVVHHRHERVEVVRRAPPNAHAKLDQHRVLDQPFGRELLREPEMAGVERLDLGLDAKRRHLPRHLAQHRGRVGHDVIAEIEVHGSTVERANLGQALRDMGDTLGRPRHVGAFIVDGQGRFNIAEDDVPAHAGGQVQNHVDVSGADPVRHLPVEIPPARRGARLRIADMAMDDGRPGLGRVDRGFGDLLRRDRHERRDAHGVAGAGDGAGDEDIAIHRQRHGDPRIESRNLTGRAKRGATHCAVRFLRCEAMIFAHSDAPLNVTLLLVPRPLAAVARGDA